MVYLGPRPGPSSLYQMPTHQRPVYQSPYCCIIGPLLCGFNVSIRESYTLVVWALHKSRSDSLTHYTVIIPLQFSWR